MHFQCVFVMITKKTVNCQVTTYKLLGYCPPKPIETDRPKPTNTSQKSIEFFPPYSFREFKFLIRIEI